MMSSSPVRELKQTVSVVQRVKELESYTHLSLLLLLSPLLESLELSSRRLGLFRVGVVLSSSSCPGDN